MRLYCASEIVTIAIQLCISIQQSDLVGATLSQAILGKQQFVRLRVIAFYSHLY